MTAVVSPNLVRQAQDGDADAINDILTRVDRVVCKLSRKGGAQPADAEDRAQEIRIALWQKAIPTWDESKGAAFPTWAWWAGNSKIRVLRTSAARKPKEYSFARPDSVSGKGAVQRTALSLGALFNAQKTALEKLDAEEATDTLRKAFNYLQADEKLLLTLRYWESKTLREISRGSKNGDIDLGRSLSHQGCLSLERRALKHLEKVIRFLTQHRADRSRRSS